jgi:ribosomal-protein-alanine N-acetyltransferase
MIETNNLQLIICERNHIEAFSRSKHELGAILQVAIPESWPYFPEAFSLPSDDSPELPTEWHGYFFIHTKNRVLVGNGGFKGEPDDAGTVELGYEIASEYWNQGFATEAVQGMIQYAFAHEQVQAILAHTLAGPNASNRVLQKVGMKFIEALDDPEEIKVWQWRLSRDDYQAKKS